MSMSNSFGNPWFSEDKLHSQSGSGTMTVGGTVTKLIVFLLLMLTTGGYTMMVALDKMDHVDFSLIETITETDASGEEVSRRVYVTTGENGERIEGPLPQVDLGEVVPLMWGGLIVGFIAAMVCIFAPRTAPISGSIYALAEGFALGGISAMYEIQFGGIVMQAAVLTVGVLLVMLALYATRIIKASGPLVAGVIAATGGICVLYIVDLVMRGFFGSEIGIIHSTGPWGIGFSVLVCVIAAFNFIIDFDTIERGVKGGAPKHMEWYSAFGVLLTLVWLYLEILRLIAKLRSSNN